VKQVETLNVGDPMDPETEVGPLIDRGALEKVESMVNDAVAAGAEVLVGGERRDPFYAPTVLGGVRPEMEVCREEIFGPVTTVARYQTFDEAVDQVNGTAFGLHAGVFTSTIDLAFQAHRDIVAGGVIVNDVSAFRADQMPYGGSKESGYGREGLRYAIEEMTEPRILVLSHVPL
ncbi:MAG TPA: aldehyde dehydrogenase family protein, partial [Actinomycetota bacterium]|nr:aldehyde dehydrogenase family protein [Actinomycetota bacterium]